MARHQSKADDFVQGTALPVSQVVVLIWALLSPNSPWRWLLITVAFAIVANALWPRIARSIRKRRGTFREQRLAEQEFPKFKGLVQRFGDFANNRTNDTLHRMIQAELSQRGRTALALRLDPMQLELWNSFWEQIDGRMRRQRADFDELSPSIQEFDNLIRQYHRWCITPIFDRFGDDLRAELNAEDIRKLKGFLDDYRSFVSDYTQFQRSLAASHPSFENLPHYLPTPRPL